MSTTMTKADYLDTIRADWAAWESLVESIPDERKAEPGAAGHWSVKDLIAHVSVYERWTIEWLEPALEGKPPAWDYPEGEDTRSLDDRNARFYEQNRDRSLEDIKSEAREVHARMMAAIERIPEEAIAADIRSFAPEVGAYYHAGTNVWQAIDGNAAEHYRHHIADVQAWLEA